jgi:HEAT repeat protein
MRKFPLLCLVISLPGCGGEPVFNGQPLSAWFAVLDDPAADPGLRSQATNLLTELGTKDKTVLAGLIRSVKHGSYGAADVLGRIGPVGDHTADVVAALAEAVKNKESRGVRTAAARALTKFGPSARPALPALFEMLKDPNPVTRQAAAEVLGDMAWIGKDATGPLMQAAKDEKLDVSRAARDALDKLDPDALKLR